MMPTRKWWAATVVGIGGFATAWIQAGFTTEVKIAGVALTVQRLVAYLTPNATPEG